MAFSIKNTIASLLSGANGGNGYAVRPNYTVNPNQIASNLAAQNAARLVDAGVPVNMADVASQVNRGRKWSDGFAGGDTSRPLTPQEQAVALAVTARLAGVTP